MLTLRDRIELKWIAAQEWARDNKRAAEGILIALVVLGIVIAVK